MALGTKLMFRVRLPPGLDRKKLTQHDLLEDLTNIIIHTTFIGAFHQTCNRHKVVLTWGFHDIMVVRQFSFIQAFNQTYCRHSTCKAHYTKIEHHAIIPIPSYKVLVMRFHKSLSILINQPIWNLPSNHGIEINSSFINIKENIQSMKT